jgi:hypothetical protein
MMNVKKPDEDVIGRRKKVSSEDEAADDEDRRVFYRCPDQTLRELTGCSTQQV